jgi:metal-dependent amidase/aminoacylase/carboxypeptidase family protein
MILKYGRKLLLLGEDFGFFTQQYPGAMFGLGSGITTALHNPDYDFPDDLSVRGFRFHQISKEITNAH